MFRSIEIDANYLPMDLPMRSLAIPNKSEQSLSRVESFQNPIVDLLCLLRWLEQLKNIFSILKKLFYSWSSFNIFHRAGIIVYQH